MPKKHNQESFILRAKEIHGDKYDYSKVVFNDITTPVTIICASHSDVEISPEVHLRTVGCQKCGKEIKIEKNKKSTEYFLEEVKKVWGNTYEYNNLQYIASNKKLKVTCKIHGEFEKLFCNLIKGSGCPTCGNLRKSKTKINLTTEQFIKESEKIHGLGTYDYSEVNYQERRKKVTIICPTHGRFLQSGGNHLSGFGCRQCSDDKSKERGGWNYTNWDRNGKTSKDFDSFKLYLIRCWGQEEEFYKIGKTFLTLEKRFSSFTQYNWEEVDTLIFDDSVKASEKEIELKREYKEYQYKPNQKFSGYFECYNLELPFKNILKE